MGGAMMINAADFLKWLSVFNVPYGGGVTPGGVSAKQVQESAFNFQLVGSGTANDAFIVNLSPAVTTLTDGLIVTMNSGSFSNLTTTPTLQVNALAPITITLWGGLTLLPNDISQNSVYLFLYNLTNNRFELINPSVSIPDTSSVQGNLYNSNPDIGVADAYEINLVPDYPNTIYPNGFTVFFEAQNTNTGASTLTTNGNTYPISIQGVAPLNAGDIVAGNVYWCVFNNTSQYWVLMNPEVTRVSHGGTGNTTVGSVGTIAQSDGTKYTFTTATYPSTTSINKILYSSAANTVGEIADTVGGVLVSNSTGVPSMLTNPADNYRVLMSKSADTPVWSTAAYPQSAPASGQLMQSDGTDWGSTSATYPSSTNKDHILYSSANNTVGEISTQKNAVLISDNSNTPQWSSSLTDGQLIIGNTNNPPSVATLTAGSNITITNAAGSITISSSGGSGLTWTEVTGTSQTMVAGNGYISSNSSLVTLTLPTTASLGTVINVQGKGSGGWKIAQNASQVIHFGNVDTTTGTSGYLASGNRYDSIQLLCITANTDWAVISTQGVVTYN